MESVLHPTSLHFFTENYPHKKTNLNSFFSQSTTTENKDNALKQAQRQQRRKSSPLPIQKANTSDDNDDNDNDINNSIVFSKQYHRWSWTASSTLLPMETIQEEEE